jgi:acetylornithine deacetylase/succinyl-diaminopimelate desuccinylase
MSEQLLKEIRQEDLVCLAQELIRIPSVVKGIDEGNELKIADFIARRLEKKGFEVRLHAPRKGRPNIIATLKGSGRGYHLMLNGHLDTVETEGMTVDPFAGIVENGRLYGRGSVDMKSALAAFILIGETVSRLGIELRGDLTISGCMDEEGRAIGSQTMARSLHGIDAAIVGEATEMKIGVAHKGLTFITIHTYGKATHGSSPHLGINAIMAMNKVLTSLEKELPKRFEEKRHPTLGPPTYNIGLIRGGYRANVVPDHCEVEIDRRMVPGETVQSVLDEIEAILNRLRQDDPNLKADAKALDWVKALPMDIPKDEYIVQSVSKSLKAMERKPETTTLPYWTDASSFVNLAHIPTVVFGPGDVRQAHSADEHVDIQEVFTYAKVIALTVLDFCNREKPS